MYKVTEHQFLIHFLPSTRLGEVHTDAPVIKSERFMMRRYDQLQVLANTNLELPGLFSVFCVYRFPLNTVLSWVCCLNNVWKLASHPTMFSFLCCVLILLFVCGQMFYFWDFCLFVVRCCWWNPICPGVWSEQRFCHHQSCGSLLDWAVSNLSLSLAYGLWSQAVL